MTISGIQYFTVLEVAGDWNELIWESSTYNAALGLSIIHANAQLKHSASCRNTTAPYSRIKAYSKLVYLFWALNYKLGMLTHRCLLGKAPVYLSNCCIPVSQVATQWHLWPYRTSTSSQHLRCSMLCQTIYDSPQSAQQPSDNHWRHTFSLPISTFSALGVSHVMRYINARYLLTYPVLM